MVCGQHFADSAFLSHVFCLHHNGVFVFTVSHAVHTAVGFSSVHTKLQLRGPLPAVASEVS